MKKVPGKKSSNNLLIYSFYKKQHQQVISTFLIASKYCGSVLKNDFVVVVLVVVGVLANFYHIFKESDYFESLVETCPKRKIIVGAA